MRFGHFFVDRPIFAAVLSIIMVVVGAVALLQLPVAQYPQIAPPTINVRAVYPGANAQTIAETVATPLEQAINGVEGMIYQSSSSTQDGTLSLTVTFQPGVNLDNAQVQVQNRVSTATPRLPAEVRQLGVSVNKASSDFLLIVNLTSPDQSLSEYELSNYALVNINDTLTRVDGVGSTFLFGVREPSLRVWLDPARLAAFGLSAGDVFTALQQQNVQVSGGTLGAAPAPADAAFEVIVTTQGRFQTAEQFRDVIVRSANGRILRLRDVARVEIGARSYATNSYLNGLPSVGIAVQQRPGTNALTAAGNVKTRMDELARSFPPGLRYDIVYNPTEFVAASIEAVRNTFIEAIVLVVLVVFIFLQSFRAALIPILAIPVSLVGAFAVMAALGFSINMLTLFGLILAIGIVVDDAIVVVENVERNIREGLSPREAARKTMDEVGTAVIAITLVLCAVFVPTAFIPGISGSFYQQFAVTIAAATVISGINSLTLSPALAALLLKPHRHEESPGLGRRLADRFNSGFDALAGRYAGMVGFVAAHRFVFLLIYGGLIGATMWIAGRVPTGFVPASDQGYVIVAAQLPEGASLERTDAVVKRAIGIIREVPGVADTVGIAGFSGATFTAASNAAAIFVPLKPFEERIASGRSADAVVSDLQRRLFAIQEGFVIVIKPPTVQGLGQGGGFRMQVQDRGAVGLEELERRAQALVARANQTPGLVGVFTTFSTRAPQISIEIDRTKAQILNVPLQNVFQALQVYVGSAYVNDFSYLGRAFQVTVQADAPFRVDPQDLVGIKVRSASGALVPLGTLVSFRPTTGPATVTRHNIYPAISVQGSAAPGVSSIAALDLMEGVARATLGEGVGFEWTELAYQERNTGNTALFVFAIAVLFVFLFLAAQYESWSLPLAIILIVPLAILAALGGVLFRGMDNNIMTQVAFVVLIGLAAKNAILIVEFARQREDAGETPFEAVVEACRLRLRPILMTSLAFILGVTPLALATGPGAELRQAIGTAVAFGMSGVTLLGLFLTPVFYVTIRSLLRRSKTAPAPG